MWFEDLMGFREEGMEEVRANCVFENGMLTSRVNGQSFQVGDFEILSLGDLRKATVDSGGPGRIQVAEQIGDVKRMHVLKENDRALFQVASQFNLLEMVSPSVTPEDGVGIYEFDGTQGPACAIACGAGTIFRNYFLPIERENGQSETRQVDCLAGIGHKLGNSNESLWKMKNGYALASHKGLEFISAKLHNGDAEFTDSVRAALQVGVHWKTQVTINKGGKNVAQVYGSALPVSYSELSADLWESFAKLVLEASSEATFRAALLNRKKSGSGKVFLTLLGGGAFGNRIEWIISAIRRSLVLFNDSGLDVRIVSYGASRPEVVALVNEMA